MHIENKFKVTNHFDFKEELKRYQFVNFCIGPNYEILVIGISDKPEHITANSGVTLPLTRTKRKYDYKIVIKSNNKDFEFIIPNEDWNFRFAQPLSDTEMLLACARSRYYNEGKFDENGRVYSTNGSFLRGFLLGDGIDKIQANSKGEIWTSYFDEGIFGNLGWRNPVGVSGLVCWDSDGNKIFEYQPKGNLDHIDDCYALNVAKDDEVWFYYYYNFPLVQLKNKKELKYWNCPIAGSRCFAVHDNFIVISEGYYNEYFSVLKIENEGIEIKKKYIFTDESGEILSGKEVDARGEFLFFRKDFKFYRLNVRDILRGI